MMAHGRPHLSRRAVDRRACPAIGRGTTLWPTRGNRMPSETTDFIEQGRRVFAGDWQFIAAAGSLDALPPMAGMEVAFAGRSNVGKSSLINALTGRNALARTSHTPGRTQELIFFQGPPHVGPAAGRHAGLRLRLGAEDEDRRLDRPDPRLPAGPRQSRPGLCADRQPPRLQGRRPRRAEDVRSRRRQLPDRADQGRPGESGRARPAHRRDDGRAEAASGGVSRCHRHVIENRRRHAANCGRP